MDQLAKLFFELYRAASETDVDQIIARYPQHFESRTNWRPYGRDESYFAVIENQQASPVPALVEKITNSIDAILMRRCLESGLDPRSPQAPRSIEEAVQCFFPEARNWDLSIERKKQAENIQIIADGPKLNPSLVIYDNGEGQHPEDFETTLLSLLRGNKNEIRFVQGKYNMGGAGAIVFCGKKRYQLVASKRYDGSGDFGFTLIRRHPMTEVERETRKNTWYEYLVINGKIPSFPITELDLGLYNRKFTTGTVIKLYSYDLPAGSRSVISRDLNQSINEYLFEPALPIYTIDTKERYPDDRNLQRELFGLKRRLEEENSKYVEKSFSQEYSDDTIGRIKITCYVFKALVEDKDAQASRESIRREFFKNNMSVLFSLHGQVHGHFTSEFITRSLKFPLLKDHLLIHVDCTGVKLEFRNELFMASRDRLKDGEESRALRAKLAELLKDSELKDIYKRRRASLSVESSDSSDLLKRFSKNLPLSPELTRLLDQTFKLEAKSPNNRAKEAEAGTKQNPRANKREEPSFNPRRFPSIFNIQVKNKGEDGLPLVQVPRGSERTIRFSTDVEDQYFDRTSEPGELRLALLSYSSNKTDGGSARGNPSNLESILHVAKASPDSGTIRVVVKPSEKLQVGDVLKIRAELSAPEGNLEQVFWIRVSEPAQEQRPEPQPEPEPLGLPGFVLVRQEAQGNRVRSWSELEAVGIPMNHAVVVHPLVEGDTLETVYINMDSSVLLNYKSRLTTQDQLEVAERRYITSVYFHTLFLYMISKNRRWAPYRQGTEGAEDESPDLAEYLKDVFASHYAEFLLNFGTGDLIASLAD
ncbi:hypothetical protein Mterra_00623 [Calidithermus terrae]|uniref:Histidine kinase-, DNA gyrase B-, and HSP90-like ATPase n=1 Tax=Calidithermus terrae TaxID=1408545 RepID=A0A399F1Z5_9DEIN|nr:hypothetical protein [Calidithermus terrae]RIH90248.1 hypothetical protein Mterra_00623 [Calidithermus terrae]